MLRWATAAGIVLFLASCSSASPETGTSSSPGSPAQATWRTPSTPVPVPVPVLMPDLVGLPSADAGRRIGELEASARLGLSSNWGMPIVVRCGARPRTVLYQHPAPGTPLKGRTKIQIRTAALDLDKFRGPCEPHAVNDGPVAEAHATLAREFYRFAANPALGAPFASGDVWVGIEDGPKSTRLAGSALGELVAWELDTGYAERSGPFSALDTLAESGGYYELRDGVAETCPGGNDKAPPELDGLRAISLTAPGDVTSACLEWWTVTLFLDSHDRIRGVALRLGSP